MTPDEIKLNLKAIGGCVNFEALEYISELEAENKRLNKKVEELSEVLSEHIKINVQEIKSEGIKEFAERLKGKLFCECGDINYSEFCETRRLIDKLVKAMVGGEK